MRAIIRFSVDNEANSALRNKLAGHLDAEGFVRANNTSTWEITHISAKELRSALSEFWKRVHQHQGTGRIDHFWMYSDRSDLDDIHPDDGSFLSVM